MLDCQIYGLEHPGGHHLTNVLLHAAAAILLFLVLRQMTGELWPSALVAALFAIHPLHVESVAWVAERKDVLSGLFFMLTSGGLRGLRAAARSRCCRYLLVTVLFALGLMAKPMLVTLPFVLLLLDYWPLGRLGAWRRCLAEKLPLLALAAASCVATILAQRAVIAAAADTFPFSWRLGNVPYSYVAYTVQFFYPVGLTPKYPYPPGGPPAWQAIAAAMARGGRYRPRPAGCPQASLPDRRLAVVPGHVGARDRPGASRRTSRWPTVIVPAADRAEHHAGLAAGSPGELPAAGARGRCCGVRLRDCRPDGLRLVANRLLARQRSPLAPYPGLDLAKRHRP